MKFDNSDIRASPYDDDMPNPKPIPFIVSEEDTAADPVPWLKSLGMTYPRAPGPRPSLPVR